MIRQLFILLIMLAWSIALLATILPAFPHTDLYPNTRECLMSGDLEVRFSSKHLVVLGFIRTFAAKTIMV